MNISKKLKIHLPNERPSTERLLGVNEPSAHTHIVSHSIRGRKYGASNKI